MSASFRPIAVALAAAGVLVAVAVASLMIGQVMLSPSEVLAGLGSIGSGSMESRIVVDLRLPRVLAAILGGAALGLAGLMMQTLFQNPLADAWSLGLMAGGQLGAALVIVAGAVVGPSFLMILTGFAGLGVVAGSALGTLAVALAMSAMARRVGAVTGSFFGGLAFIGVLALIGALSYTFLVGRVERIAEPAAEEFK